MLVTSIRSDNESQHHVRWRPRGHELGRDFNVQINDDIYDIQVKAGKFNKKQSILSLSGPRTGRISKTSEELFNNFLNEGWSVQILTIPYQLIKDNEGEHHEYRIGYIEKEHLTTGPEPRWEIKKNKNDKSIWTLINHYDITIRRVESMSWQVWWHIPVDIIELFDWFRIRRT